MIFYNELNKRVALDCKEFVKYLEILIDNHLSWKHHIELSYGLMAWDQACKSHLDKFL